MELLEEVKAKTNIEIAIEIETLRSNNIEDDTHMTAVINWLSEYCLDITKENLTKYIPPNIIECIKKEAEEDNMIKPSMLSKKNIINDFWRNMIND